MIPENFDPVYYRIYLNKEDLLTIVTMQSFDEDDYNQHRFLKNNEGKEIQFDYEDVAIQYLNDNYRFQSIDPKYRTPNNKNFQNEFKKIDLT